MLNHASYTLVTKAPQMYRTGARLAGLAGVGAAMFCLSACISADDRAEMAKANSILAPVFKQMSPADAAAWAADPYDADKRARGMNMLANAPFGGAEAYVRMYRDRLKDDNAPVRAVACRALGLHGSADDVPLIAPLTKAEEVLVRLEATRALQRLHNPVAVPALIDRLDMDKESEPEIRAEAASALGQYAEGSGMQALIKALADPSLLVDRSAHASLKTLTGNDDLPADRKAWVNWVKATEKPFAGQRPYVYPVFQRDSRWLDYVPFVGGPIPNEQPSTPIGFSLEEGAGATGTADPGFVQAAPNKKAP
ncbi:MAG TPA: HEAT repeat domain-containing protein [Phycisphaerales bacterium]|nr:HEAT repeat domain-containing protein [Phycisphaerales bacterium]